MRKYHKIARHGNRGTHLTIGEGSRIVIMEKLDGANSSFGYIDGELKCFSRNQELDNENNLRGFYQWVHSNIDKEELVEGAIYFGEWLVKHTINYPEEAYNNFYLFDIFDSATERYVDSRLVEEQATKLKLELVPIFYTGEFQSLEHIKSFVGQSEIGDTGEGVVVKNYSYEDKYGNQVFTKFVSDDFAEKSKAKKHRFSKYSNELDEFVDTFLTKPRVEKMLHKLVDEGIVEENPDITDMGTILKNSGSRIVDDILEEEMDSLIKLVKRKIGKAYPLMVKEVLLEL